MKSEVSLAILFLIVALAVLFVLVRSRWQRSQSQSQIALGGGGGKCVLNGTPWGPTSCNSCFGGAGSYGLGTAA